VNSATANQPFVFSPGVSPSATGTDPLVNETRREIAEIVREVASAVRSDRTADDFLGMLADRVLRAMAAEGVLIWARQANPTPTYQCIRRLGRVTDQTIPAHCVGTHHRLLVEVADEGQPVVVPATPGASDASVPINPTDAPVAIVPIELEPTPDGADYLLEVFLEPGCGIATQRGYLRFVAQMADLAGEFLRADQLRRLKRAEVRRQQVDQAIAKFHLIHASDQLTAAIVDQALTVFEFDRVGFCVLEPDTKLIAVSHVNVIDQKSPAANQICEAAETDLDPDGCAWFADPPLGAEAVPYVRVVVAAQLQASGRLVCLQMPDAPPISPECRAELTRYVQHADFALHQLTRFESIPGGRLLTALAPALQVRRSSFWKTIITTAVIMTMILLVALFPVPLVVYSTATIRPQEVQTISAPRPAVVDQIHVRHGQSVLRGERLLTLVDPELEEQLTTLMGRRAVLLQQQSHWTETLVDTTSNQRDRYEQIQGEQRLVSEEIQTIDDQMSVLNRVLESLVIRADRNGIVDAWQIEQRLASRPLQRGDVLLQVIAENTPWIVEASVAQSRIAHVQQAADHTKLTANVALESNPNQILTASLAQVGPSHVDEQNSQPSTSVLLRLNEQASTELSARQGIGNQSGAPARVMFHCGQTPVAYVLLQDLIRSVRGTLGLYLGAISEPSGDET
jgi:HlyD family secretion protein